MLITSPNEVAEFLANERKEMELSQAQFGRLLRIDQQLVSLYERGRQSMNLSIFVRSMDRLGFDIILRRRPRT